EGGAVEAEQHGAHRANPSRQEDEHGRAVRGRPRLSREESDAAQKTGQAAGRGKREGVPYAGVTLRVSPRWGIATSPKPSNRRHAARASAGSGSPWTRRMRGERGASGRSAASSSWWSAWPEKPGR